MASNTRRNFIRALHIIACVFTLGMPIQTWTAAAQPVLTTKRCVYLDPVVELYWTVSCGDSVAAVSRDGLRIVENDTTEIPDYELVCPEPGKRHPVSTALVLDHSGSMTGAGITGLKEAAHAFVDAMDTTADETAIVWFSSAVSIGSALTSDRPRLHDVIDAVPPMGMTACWDGIYAGVVELLDATPGQSRTVIAITDGGDGSSSRTPMEIIALAQREHVRIVTISLGTSTNKTELEFIGQLTGGRYFTAPQATQLPSIFLEAQALATRMFDECSATYVTPIPCPVNLLRTARVTLSDVCGDTLSFTRTYRTLHDSTRLTPVRFALGNAEVGPDRVARIPLLTARPFPLDSLPPFTCDIAFSFDELRFLGIAEDSAAAVAPGPGITMDIQNNMLHMVSHFQRALRGDTIAVLLADAFALPRYDSTNCSISYASFHEGCLHAVRSGGSVRLEMELRPEMQTEDTVRLGGRVGESSEHAIVVKNTGGAVLSVNSINFPDHTGSELRCVTDLPRVIPPRGTAVFSLLFTPAQSGRSEGRMIIGTNSTYTGNYHTVPILTDAVSVATPAAPLLPASVDFGSIAAGVYSDTTIRISNPNNTPLGLLSVSLAGEDAMRFEITRVPASVLPALGVDSLTLRVSQHVSAGLAARLEIEHDAPGLPPAVCALRANVGWPGRAILRPVYESFSMYSVPVGMTQQEVRSIRNVGGLPLVLADWRFSLQDTSILRFVPPLPSVIEAGETALLRVEFSPPAQTSYRSDILFSTNDPELPEGRYYFYGSGSKPVDAGPPATSPSAFRIAGLHPNPTRGALTLSVDLPQAARLQVTVRDLLGRILHEHDFGVYAPGFRNLRIALPALRPGTYIVTAGAGDTAHSRLFTVIR